MEASGSDGKKRENERDRGGEDREFAKRGKVMGRDEERSNDRVTGVKGEANGDSWEGKGRVQPRRERERKGRIGLSREREATRERERDRERSRHAEMPPA